jgi:hypothetical protein
MEINGGAKINPMEIVRNLQPSINAPEIRKRLHLEKDSEEWNSV